MLTSAMARSWMGFVALVVALGIVVGPSCRAERPEVLGMLDRAEEIEWLESGFGLGGGSRVLCSLRREAEAWKGTALISVEMRERKGHTSVEVAIPAKAASIFLDQLSAVPLETGPYLPREDHTDDSPKIRITIDVNGQRVVFHSESQVAPAERRSPWALNIGPATYVIRSNEPDTAFDNIEPYLSEVRRLSTVLERACRDRGPSTASSPTTEVWCGPLLPAPLVISPRHQSVVSYSDPVRATTTLTWEAVPGALAYRVQVDSTPFFESPTVDRKVEQSSLDLTGLKEGKYYWRVAAVDARATDGYFSDFSRFLLEMSKPARP